MALVDGIRNPNSSLTFVRDDGSSFTTAPTPEAEDYFARIPRRQEQSDPLAMGGGDGASASRSQSAPVASDAAPDMTGGAAGSSGGGYSTKGTTVVAPGASTG